MASRLVLLTTGSASICNSCVVTVSFMLILIKAKFPGNVSPILAEQLVLLFQLAAAS